MKLHWHAIPGISDFQFPLDTGDKKIDEIVKEKKDRGELSPTPITCSECHFMYCGQPACPNCGHRPQKQRKAKVTNPGKLVLVNDEMSGQADREARKAAYQRQWNKCLAVAANRGEFPGGTFQQALGMFYNIEKTRPEHHGLDYLPKNPSNRDNWKVPITDIYPGFRKQKG